MLFKEDLIASLECALFVSNDPLSIETLSQLLSVNKEELIDLIESYGESLATPGRGIELKEVAGGYKLQTKKEYDSLIESIVKPQGGQLSRAALEILAIVAYKQPVTRSEVEKIRGVGVDSMFLKLVEKELIYEVGRKEVPGRPILYGTSSQFLMDLGIDSLEDLPPLEEKRVLENEDLEEVLAFDDEAMVFEKINDNKVEEQKND
ncbi:SMC-Scp complex subunit ScpB [endosymbiont 'TC1' of Trimyema compressum]|uniref:SMC-Scp complex subunit ScpB n=1 Tax=endosymbiont 'TC1' of Trimyema compressum TaxID=243899 RepID=UPI000A6FE0EF|nr:SMC-Scp complex subunit ScpB [endosymbiont 'TC1' of Trimyema compressum]